MQSIKDMVSQNKKVTFIKYHNKELWYKTECGFEFPIPIADTQEAVFLTEDKALLFMRWIRKHINYLNSAKQETYN